MAREPGTKDEARAASPDSREIGKLQQEIASLKGQLRQTAPPNPTLPVKYETVESEEAARYERAGGRVVSVTKRFPDRPFTAGKKYGFAETKEELEGLTKSAKEAGIL